jgi:hypothetical protein
MGRLKKNKEPTTNTVVPLKETLGIGLIGEIADKDWNTQPSEVEIKKEEPRNPKVRNSPNSKKSIAQSKLEAEKVKATEVREARPRVDPMDYIKLPPNVNKEEFMVLLPNTRIIFNNDKEEKRFFSVVNVYLSGFDFSELSASDIADIIDLAKNSILEDRLLAATAPKLNKAGELVSGLSLLDISATIEKFRKHSSTIKNNLANRRVDKIDPKSRQNFSIVDIVYAYDDKMKKDFNDRIEALEKESKEYMAEKLERECKVAE